MSIQKIYELPIPESSQFSRALTQFESFLKHEQKLETNHCFLVILIIFAFVLSISSFIIRVRATAA